MVQFDLALQRAHHTASGWSERARPAGSSATSVRGHSVRRSPVRNLLSLDDAAWEKDQLGQLSGSPPRPSERGSEHTTPLVAEQQLAGISPANPAKQRPAPRNAVVPAQVHGIVAPGSDAGAI
ncbi:hypothetical protein LA080_005754 [Diaporthe eres]|nr:hypothetical protein LA080_005754 [Diaporthe eres]